MPRRVYPTRIVINGRAFSEIIIDPHYEEKHSRSVTDEIIIELVHLLRGRRFAPAKVDNEGFQYFVNDHMEIEHRFYKLIWLLHEKESFIGVINAYRR